MFNIPNPSAFPWPIPFARAWRNFSASSISITPETMMEDRVMVDCPLRENLGPSESIEKSARVPFLPKIAVVQFLNSCGGTGKRFPRCPFSSTLETTGFTRMVKRIDFPTASAVVLAVKSLEPSIAYVVKMSISTPFRW